MSIPDYLLCLECDTAVYVFEWREGEIKEALCPTCGNEELDHFAALADIEEIAESWTTHQRQRQSYYPRKPDAPRGH
jgi:hypothetical protein